MILRSTYLLDANVFVEAAKRYYAFDLVPAFWTKLIELASSGLVESIDRVKQELERGKDQLAKWSNVSFSQAFASTDQEDILERYREIMIWAQRQSRFTDAARSEFAGSADGWLIAYARVKGHVVVTHEQPAPNAKSEIKIPDVCLAFDTRFVDTFGMLRELGVRIA